MARRVSDYRIRRIADRGNEEDGPDSRARGDRLYHNRRSADLGNEKRSILRLIPTPGLLNQSIRIFSEDEPRFDEDEVDIDEGERLFLEQALRWIPEGVPMA
nr:hypothetical protein [Tanacetum cinerariifolium]